MARGQPDYGSTAPKTQGATLSDMADLAVRLGSVVEYDRRGDVILIDDCEGPVIRPRISETTSSEVILSTDASVSGVQAIKLTTGAVATEAAGVYYYPRPIVTGKHGVKVSCNFYEMVGIDGYLHLDIYLTSFTTSYNSSIRIHPKNETLEYLDSNGEYQVFATGVRLATAVEKQFHDLKMVVDLDNGKYERFLLDTLEWDLSAYSLQSETGSFNLSSRVFIDAYTSENTAIGVHIDDIVYTINEP